jgi:hypothetical protein
MAGVDLHWEIKRIGVADAGWTLSPPQADAIAINP